MGEHPEVIHAASRVVVGNHKYRSRSYGPRFASELEVRCEYPPLLGSTCQSTEPFSRCSYQEMQNLSVIMGKHQTNPH